ncbi:MAG: amidohydrolase family protein, partial [Deltaproteobacteria bacterium]|nr:amidohydrolase family protein [Nannocystaceae bacterium]
AMATQAGSSLGRAGQIGRIQVGQIADIVLVDTTGLHHLGDGHPVPALGLHARAGDVTTVIVDGRVVVERGVVLGVDETVLAARARQALKIAGAHG